MSYHSFSLKIMLGNPNFHEVVQQSQQYGCQQSTAIPWTAPMKGEKPRSYVQRVLTENTAIKDEICVVYMVVCGQRILPIPTQWEERKNLLDLLSGRRHQIWVGFGCQVNTKIRSKIVTIRVSFKHLTADEIQIYLSNLEGQDCCGGYHPNGSAARFIKSINGSPSALQGLPAFEFHSFISSVQGRG